MSRKQRAAKILTGDTGLTGLDALTEGEGGFEAALLNAITETDALIDPRDLFTQDAIEDDITNEDNAFWNVDVDDEPESHTLEADMPVPTLTIVATPTRVTDKATVAQKQLATLVVSDSQLDEIVSTLDTPAKDDAISDDLVRFMAEELGGVVRGENNEVTVPDVPEIVPITPPAYMKQLQFVAQYLEQYPNTEARGKWLVDLLALIRDGVWDDQADVKKVAGIEEPYFLQSTAMQKRLHSTVRSYLRKRQLAPYDVSSEVAKRVIELSLMALNLIPIQLDIFATMRINKQQEISKRNPRHTPQPPKKPSKRKGKMLDLMAVPDDEPVDAPNSDVVELKQLAFF